MEKVVRLEGFSNRLRDMTVVLVAALLLPLFANLSFRFPFTPVPITLQVHVALLLGALLGSKRGALAVLLYLVQGACGFPVFALGKSGLLHLLSPTGGYLLGYVAGAYVTGYLVEQSADKTARRAVLAMAAGNGVVYALGVMQLSLYLGFKSALMLGVLPFIVGDVVKLVLARQALRFCRPYLGFERDL
jgi:biotin transport system substrate-specific component